MIRNCGGTITAFDGDRVMAVFIGGGKNSAAAKATLRINWAGIMINKEIKVKYPKVEYVLSHVVGVDTSSLFVARTGIRDRMILFGWDDQPITRRSWQIKILGTIF
jgi:hypothetical protein